MPREVPPMTRCQRMVDAGRRKFLTGAGFAAAGVAASQLTVTQAQAGPPPPVSTIRRTVSPISPT